LVAVVFPTDELRNKLNEDHQFRNAARRWNAQLLLRVGDKGYLVEIVDGHILRFDADAGQFDGFSVMLSGTEDTWEQLLAPVPRPFYQDFIAAFFQHGFEIAGDLESAFSYYWALLRMLEVMRTTSVLQAELH
jgi:hypothetical protein